MVEVLLLVVVLVVPPVGLASVPLASLRLSLLLLCWLPLCKVPLLESWVLPEAPDVPELFIVPLCEFVPDCLVSCCMLPEELLPEVPVPL